MAVQGPFKVEFGDMFPFGALVHRVDKKRDFNASTKDNEVQAKDKETGLPLWIVTIIDRDPEARPAVAMVRVNVASPHQPVPPKVPDGAQFAPVEFEGLRVMPYVNANGRQAFSLRADAMKAADPSRQANTGRKEAA